MEVYYENLKCETCQEFSVPPIQTCGNGHLTCGICFKKYSNCCSCSQPLVPLVLGQRDFSQDFELPCKNSNQGCSKMISSSEMKEHVLASCKYLIRGKYSPPQEVQSSNGEFQVDDFFPMLEANYPRTFNAVKFDGNKFFYHSALQQGLFYFWLSIIGDESLAKKYYFELNSPLKATSDGRGTGTSFPFEIPSDGTGTFGTGTFGIDGTGTGNQIQNNNGYLSPEYTWKLPVIPFGESELIKVQEKGQAAVVPCEVFGPFFLEMESPRGNIKIKSGLIMSVHKIVKL